MAASQWRSATIVCIAIIFSVSVWGQENAPHGASTDGGQQSVADPPSFSLDGLFVELKWHAANDDLVSTIATGEFARLLAMETFGRGDRQYIEFLQQAAFVYEDIEVFSLAEKSHKEVLAWWDKECGESWWQTVDARLALADCQSKSRWTRRQRLRWQQATQLSNNSVGYLNRGHGIEATAQLTRSIAIHRELLGVSHPTLADLMCLCANIHVKNSSYEFATPLYEQALTICRHSLPHEYPLTATVLDSWGELLQLQGDRTSALKRHEEANQIILKVHGENHPSLGDSLSRLGYLHGQNGDLDTAVDYLGQALAIHKQANVDPYRIALSHLRLARVLDLHGSHVDAVFHAEAALVIYRSLDPIPWYYVAGSLTSLASIHRMHGDYQAALPYQEESLAIAREILGPNHMDLARAESGLAFLYQHDGQTNSAAGHFRRAYDIVDQVLEASAVLQSENSQLMMAKEYRDCFDNLLDCTLEMDDTARIAELVLNGKGRVVCRQRAVRILANTPELAPHWEEYQSLTSQWARMATEVITPDLRDHFHQVETRKLEVTRLLNAESKYFKSTDLVSPTAITEALPANTALVDFVEMYPGQEQNRLFAIVYTSGIAPRICEFGRTAPIAAAIDKWRSAIHAMSEEIGSSVDKNVEARQASRMLREKLWLPLEALIGSATTILISPDGMLGMMPWGAIPGDRPDSNLIERYTFVLVPVPRLLIDDDFESPIPKKSLLVMGEIDYYRKAKAGTDSSESSPRPLRLLLGVGSANTKGPASGTEWKPLPSSGSEIDSVRGRFRESAKVPDELIIDRRHEFATEDAFRKNAPQAAIIHLSTHGFFAGEDKRSVFRANEQEEYKQRDGNLSAERRTTSGGYSPGLLSGLVFAGANKPIDSEKLAPSDAGAVMQVDDGIMYADEIATLPLGSVRLVVLSACDTGLGEVAGGEGLLGIQRAFQVAGAQNTVASLWEVDDRATTALMQKFYSSLVDDNQSPIVALREAQLHMLEHPDAIRGIGHGNSAKQRGGRLPPYYWAAFTISVSSLDVLQD